MAHKEDWPDAHISRLKKFAELVGADYFTMDDLDGSFCRTLRRDGDIDSDQIKPRLFRKIQLDGKL